MVMQQDMPVPPGHNLISKHVCLPAGLGLSSSSAQHYTRAPRARILTQQDMGVLSTEEKDEVASIAGETVRLLDMHCHACINIICAPESSPLPHSVCQC